MNSITRKSGFQNLISSTCEGVKKKITKQGFSLVPPTEGHEVVVNYISQLEDGRTLDNTYITKEPIIFTLGSLFVPPGLEIALKSMKMGESAIVEIQPEYSFIEQEKLKNGVTAELEEKIRKKSCLKYEDFIKLEPKEARYYMNIIYEIELIKFDKPRKNKSLMEPEEKIEEAGSLKREGNELFREKRFNEAVVKYNTGLNYIYQMPSEFLNQKVVDLRVQFNLNITNCHICLFEYNYALKKVEEVFDMNNPPPTKCYYYRCIALMNLGEFEKAGKDYKILKTLLPNDFLIKQLEDDFVKIKEKSFQAKKSLIKKGIFSNNLYEEKEVKIHIQKFDSQNSKYFYLDLLINKNLQNPKKIKFEIFNFDNAFKKIFENLKNSKPIISNYSDKKILILEENIEIEEKKLSIFSADEKYLLALIKQPNYQNGYNNKTYNLCFLLDIISSKLTDEIVIIGRCIYNTDCLLSLECETQIEVIDSDYCLNI